MNVVEFHVDGSLVEHRGRNPDGSEYSARYEYDSAARLVAVTFTSTTGSTMVRRPDYGADDRLLRIVERDRDGGERVAETYEYSVTGTRTKITLVDPSNRASITAWAVDGSDAGNWTHKTVLARHAADRDFVACTVEQRAIAYYDA